MKPVKALLERIEALEKQNGPIDQMEELRRLIDEAILSDIENRRRIHEWLDSQEKSPQENTYYALKQFLESLLPQE